jgi:ATP-binding cassette subfamily B protein
VSDAPAHRTRILRDVWPFAAPSAGLFLVALVVLTPLSTGLNLVQPWLIKTGIDAYVTQEHAAPDVLGRIGVDDLQVLALVYLASVIGGFLVNASYSVCVSVGGQKTLLRMRAHVVRHLLTRSQSFFDKRPAGALLTRATSDVEALGEAISSGVVTIVLDVLMIVGSLTAMVLLDWRMTLLLLAVAPPLAFIVNFCRKRLRVLYNQVRESLSLVNAYLAERVNGMEVTQLFNDQDRATNRFVELNTPYKTATIRSNIYDAFIYAAVDGIGSICVALMLWYAAGDLFEHAGLTAGLLAAFIEYLSRLFKPLREFSGKIAVIQRAGAALDKIGGLLAVDEVIRGGERELETVRGSVAFEAVSFGYKPEHPVLHSVDLCVEPGEVVAIVGPSGCGKTTLTRLLSRTYEGYTGRITVDGVEVRELTLTSMRRTVAAVRQDVQLFPETLRFNVGLGDLDLTDAQLDEAARLVHADRVVSRHELGWDQPIRERGANLSVGEAQLVTFARTMAYDAPVVILDEATASVDPVTESLIQSAIERILERKTVIVIAHRLSTITAADRIVVMDAGRIVEQGNHAELLAMGGAYARLYEAGFAQGKADAPA